MRISYNNYIDTIPASSITALTEGIGFVISNVQDQRLSTVWRSTTPTAQTVIINLGSAIDINTAAILAHNISSSATITIDANTTNSWGSPATTKTIIYNAGIMLNFFTSVSYQWWRFSIDDPTNSDGYIQVGRLWLGNYIDIDPSSLLDFVVRKNRNDKVKHGEGGQKFASIGIGWKEFELKFPYSSYTMIEKIETMYDTVGNHSSFIFCNFDTLRGYSLVEPTYCSITNNINFRHLERMKFDYSLNLREEK